MGGYSQSALGRAFEDAFVAQRTIRFMWIGQGVFAAAGAASLTALAADSASVPDLVIRAVGGGMLGLLVSVTGIIAWNLVTAPFRQRNEARQRVAQLESDFSSSKLFDVISPTISLGLPINKLADGTYRAAAAATGFSTINIAHRGDLTSITRLTMSLDVRFTRADNKGWETTNAIQVTSMPNPLAGPRAMDFAWDTTNPRQWVLTGLPLVMAKDELLPLPLMMLSVSDANEAGAHFTQGETCALVIKLAVRTDKGTPTLPDQVITLTRSDIQDSLTKLGIEPEPGR